jgi:DNA-binding response OmpR family regulator
MPSQRTGLRVLVVDDCPDSAKLASAFLQRAGFVVQTARNGNDALALAESFDPEAALLDIGIPGLDGLTVAKELRKRRRHTLIIATTGRSSPEDVTSSHEAGCDHHLIKPLDYDAITDLLKKRDLHE